MAYSWISHGGTGALCKCEVAVILFFFSPSLLPSLSALGSWLYDRRKRYCICFKFLLWCPPYVTVMITVIFAITWCFLVCVAAVLGLILLCWCRPYGVWNESCPIKRFLTVKKNHFYFTKLGQKFTYLFKRMEFCS